MFFARAIPLSKKNTEFCCTDCGEKDGLKMLAWLFQKVNHSLFLASKTLFQARFRIGEGCPVSIGTIF